MVLTTIKLKRKILKEKTRKIIQGKSVFEKNLQLHFCQAIYTKHIY